MCHKKNEPRACQIFTDFYDKHYSLRGFVDFENKECLIKKHY